MRRVLLVLLGFGVFAGYGSAIAYILAAMVFALSIIQIRVLKRDVEY